MELDVFKLFGGRKIKKRIAEFSFRKKLVLIVLVGIVLAVGTTLATTAFSSPLSKGLVAHYPLDGEHGVKDATPNANHGTNNGATLSTGRKGEANGSYSFDGGSDRIAISDNNVFDVENITLSTWFYTEDIGEDHKVIIGKVYSTAWEMTIYGDDIYVNAYIGGVYYSYLIRVYDVLSINTWYNAVFTHNGTSSKLYLNGEIVGSASNTGGLGTNNNDIYIGSRQGSDLFFNGSISDVRIYDRALSENEIELLYDSFKPKFSTSDSNKGLVGHWMLDSENGANDLTPNGNDGTANGGVTVGGTTDRKGKTGGSATFDGTNGYVKIDVNDWIRDVDYVTISGWYYHDVQTQGAPWGIMTDVPATVSSDGFWYHIDYAGDTLKLRVEDNTNGETAWDGTYFIETGNWYYLTTIIGENKFDVYVNGVLNQSWTPTFSWSNINNDNAYLTLGYSYQTGINGKLQDVRVYNRQLGADEISLLYDSYKPKEASVGSLNKGLVLDMPLTTKHMKSSTVVSDLTPYGNDGTVSGATVGSDSTSFDGVDDYVDLGDFDLQDNSPFTYSVWINFIDSQNSKTIMGKHADSPGGASIGIDDLQPNKIKFHLNSYSSQRVNSNMTLNDGLWHFLTGIWDGTNLKLYIDGELNASSTPSPSLIFPDLNFNIGRWVGQSSQYFNGDISGVKIYNRALSESEVKLLYEKGR